MKFLPAVLAGSLALALAGATLAPAAANDAPAPTRAAFLNRVWVAKAYRGKAVRDSFSAVYIAPVSTRLLAEQNWWKRQNARKDKLGADARALGSRMRGEFQASFANFPGKKLRVASAPGPGVLVIELAIVQLVPSKAFWNAGATAAGFALPGAGLLSMAGAGSIAIEGRVRDGGNRAVIATFSDRRSDKAYVVGTAQYTWYAGAEGNIRDWAKEFAEVLNTDKVVGRPRRLALKSW